MNKVTQYKVWVHIEGLNKEGDIIEGDEYFEPIEVACVKTAKKAREVQNLAAASWENWGDGRGS